MEKYVIDGRSYETYQLKNEQLIELLKGDTLTEEQRKELTAKVIERFEYETCPKTNEGENEDNVFARQFGNYVNGKCHSKKKTAELMATEHRYLQNEMFKVCLEYIKVLAENDRLGIYDGRNEYACRAATYMIDGLISADYPY